MFYSKDLSNILLIKDNNHKLKIEDKDDLKTTIKYLKH